MKLPYADRLEIPQAKVSQYLLSSTHRAGRGKAGFFSACGFQITAWETLATALRLRSITRLPSPNLQHLEPGM